MIVMSKVIEYLEDLSLYFQIDSKMKTSGTSIDLCSDFQHSVNIQFGTLINRKIKNNQVLMKCSIPNLKNKEEH